MNYLFLAHMVKVLTCVSRVVRCVEESQVSGYGIVDS